MSRRVSTSRLPMTPENVRARIDAIREASGDPERAHSEEDKLRQDALFAIASGSFYGFKAEQLARLVLETDSIDFDRWCA